MKTKQKNETKEGQEKKERVSRASRFFNTHLGPKNPSFKCSEGSETFNLVIQDQTDVTDTTIPEFLDLGIGSSVLCSDTKAFGGFFLMLLVYLILFVSSVAVEEIHGYDINPGLVFGSLQTLFMTSVVIVTYNSISEFQAHPNPLIYYRCLLDTALALRFLLDPMLQSVGLYTEGDSASCAVLSGITQYLFIGADSWFGIMAVDLYLSLTNPFSSVKQNRRMYHVAVNAFAVSTAIIASCFTSLHGFADGNYCWSKSLRTSSISDFGPENDFLSINISNWVLFYVWMIVFYISGIAVLIFASKRLRNGLESTFRTRKGMLRNGGVSIISYTLFWTLAFLVYILLYSVEGLHKKWALNVFCYALSGRGFVNFIVWMLVNDPRKISTNIKAQQVAGADFKIRAQLNEALQQELLYYTTLGISRAAREADELASQGKEAPNSLNSMRSHKSISNLLDAAVRTEENKDLSIQFTNYEALAFRKLRCFYGINTDEFLKSFKTTSKATISEGASGAFMFFTGDKNFIVKSMTAEESLFLRKITPAYVNFLTSNYDSLLTRFLGCYKMELHNQQFYFVVMENLFNVDPGVKIHQRYDIKGSWVNRSYNKPRNGSKTKCRHCRLPYIYGQKERCPNLVGQPHEPNVVLKDNDLRTKLRLQPTESERLLVRLSADSKFLADMGIMDYSLLLGVVEVEYNVGSTTGSIKGGDGSLPVATVTTQPSDADSVSSIIPKTIRIRQSDVALRETEYVTGPGYYFVGIIDILQTWSFQKKVERFVKVYILGKDGDGLSAIDPARYYDRFLKRMHEIVESTYERKYDGTELLADPVQVPESLTGTFSSPSARVA